MDAKAQNPLRGKTTPAKKHPLMGDLSQNEGHEKATKLFQNYGETFPPKSGGTFPPKSGRTFPETVGGLFPQNLGGLTPTQKKHNPLGFEPKCAAAVLLKHTMYNYSGHPTYYIPHTPTLRAGTVVLMSCRCRPTFCFPPSRNGLRIGLLGLGVAVCPLPGPPGQGRGRGCLSTRAVLCSAKAEPKPLLYDWTRHR